MATTMNIACAAHSCSNPVIGQCGGYNRSCGRYYCADHSTGSLCSDCANQKIKQELYTDYLETAEKVKRDATPWGYGFSRSIMGLMGGLAAFAAVLGAGAMCFFSLVSSEPVQGLIIALFILLLMGGSVGVSFLGYSFQASQIRRRARNKAAVIDQTKPGFLQFFEAWDNKTPRDDLREFLATSGGVAVVLAGATAVAAVSSSDKAHEEEKIQNAVDDELKRRGHW